MRQATGSRAGGLGWSLVVGVALVGLAVLAVGGYMLRWTWTGFSENTVWDWLTLLVLPLSLVAATALFSGGRKWTPLWSALAIVLVAALVVLAYGGYVLSWTWTGFQGNTVWDWLKLLLLPIVVTGSSVRLNRVRSTDPALWRSTKAVRGDRERE
jgi:hypothetical protein